MCLSSNGVNADSRNEVDGVACSIPPVGAAQIVVELPTNANSMEDKRRKKERSVPRSYPQPSVRYCPNCTGPLDVPDSDKPHHYKCYVCGAWFEINQIDR